MTLSSTGMGKEDLFRKLAEFRAGDLDWTSGKAFGMVLNAGQEYMKIGREDYAMFLSQNGLVFSEFQNKSGTKIWDRHF